MQYFQILFLKEHIKGKVSKLDHRTFVLYDPNEETFYYYGSRNDDGYLKYVDYGGSYSYRQKESLLSMIQYNMGNFEEVITTELHFLNIEEYEYSSLNYTYIIDRLSNKTLMAAYDRQNENRDSIRAYLDILVNK